MLRCQAAVYNPGCIRRRRIGVTGVKSVRQMIQSPKALFSFRRGGYTEHYSTEGVRTLVSKFQSRERSKHAGSHENSHAVCVDHCFIGCAN